MGTEEATVASDVEGSIIAPRPRSYVEELDSSGSRGGREWEKGVLDGSLEVDRARASSGFGLVVVGPSVVTVDGGSSVKVAFVLCEAAAGDVTVE